MLAGDSVTAASDLSHSRRTADQSGHSLPEIPDLDNDRSLDERCCRYAARFGPGDRLGVDLGVILIE